MRITIDTSALIAVITNEASKQTIVQATQGALLVAPASVHWEIANAFSAMLKRERISLTLARQALLEYEKIPISFIDVNLSSSLVLSQQFNMYAYDAYLVQCAQQTSTPLLTLDKGLRRIAQLVGLDVIEVESL